MADFTNYLQPVAKRQSLKHLFLTAILLIATVSSFAYDFEVDSFYYTKLSENTVKLTCDQYNYCNIVGGIVMCNSSSTMPKYAGDIIIPSSVSDGSSSYQVVSIDDGVFWECKEMSSVKIPESVTSIGMGAFYECRSLTSIIIPDGVTSISNGVFYGCSGLTSITIPDGVTSIGDGAFSGCSGLTSITIPNGVPTIGDHTFFGCSSLAQITIPDGVSTIGRYAFYGCSCLAQITIPDGVTTIGGHAFESCDGLTSVTIGNGVTSIGDKTFLYCSNVKKLVCESITPPTCGTLAFTSIQKWGCTLYVPENSIDSYKSTSPWSEFANIKGISTGIQNINADGGVVVSSNAGNITVSGTTSGETIDVYNASGSKIKSVSANDEKTSISGLTSGNVYIVKIGGKNVKVAM